MLCLNRSCLQILESFARNRLSAFTWVCLLSPVLLQGAFFSLSADWKELPPEERALSRPLVDPDAGVEYLLVDIDIDGTVDGYTKVNYYLRFKVFNQRGLEQVDSIKIYEPGYSYARNIAARVIKPDGSTEYLEKGEIYETEAINLKDLKVSSKSFTFPGLTVGSIVDYHYQFIMHGTNSLFIPLDMDFPIQVAYLQIKPNFRYPVTNVWHNFPQDAEIEDVDNGAERVKAINLMPFPDIDAPPPRMEIMPFFAMTYMEPSKVRRVEKDFWKSISRTLHEDGVVDLRPNNSIKNLTRQLLNDVEGDTNQLKVLYDYVQKNITNLSLESSGYTSDQIADLKDNDVAFNVLKNGYGTPKDIRMLFGAMARAAGYECEYANVVDRSILLFNDNQKHFNVMPDELIAVKVGDSWTFHDPGDRFLPFGMLHWSNTLVETLIGNKRDELFAETPASALGESMIFRSAKLVLAEDGSLTGDIDISLLGQYARMYRSLIEGSSDDEILELISNELFPNFNAATKLSDLQVESLMNPGIPLSIRFTVDIPNYADRTGNRLIFIPSFFAKEAENLFDEETRALGIYFNYPKTVQDNIQFKLPDGFELENPSMPQSLGDINAFQHDLEIGRLEDGRLVYRRIFRIAPVMLQAKFYDTIRTFFRTLHQIDNHILVIKRMEQPSTPQEGKVRS